MKKNKVLKKKMLIINKATHIYSFPVPGKDNKKSGAVVLFPGDNKVSESQFKDVKNSIKQLKERENRPDEAIDAIEENLKFIENVVDKNNKWDLKELSKKDVKSIIEECFDMKDLNDIESSLIQDDYMEKSFEKAIDEQKKIINPPAKKNN
jgi:hypothetical protein